MAFEFRLPDIGEGVAEGEIVRWFVAEGDTVTRDQPMVEVLTDKANVEIPAPRAGKILKIVAREGETVPVESVLVVIGDAGEKAPATVGERAHTAADSAAAGEPGTQAAQAPAPARAGVSEQPDAPTGPSRNVQREEAQARKAAPPLS